MDKTSSELPRLLIRLPIPADARAIATLHIRSWQATYRGLLSDGYLSALDASIDRRVAFLAKAIEAGSQAIRVAELEGNLVGWSSFGSSRDEDAGAGDGELKAIYLDPQAWGQGIGTALWPCRARCWWVRVCSESAPGCWTATSAPVASTANSVSRQRRPASAPSRKMASHYR